MAIIVAFFTICFTLLGGLFALRLKDKLHLILGFSAGAVLGVALFDLIPESINLAQSGFNMETVTLFIAGGFAFYMVLDRLFSLHLHGEDECCKESHRGTLGALTLCFHSFLDGLGIGLAFKVSPAIGWVVAAAVLSHDFSDGINTVNMILKNKGGVKQAFRWLVFDALAPAFGVLAAFSFTLKESTLGLLLAIFAGFFLYIGAGELTPESHHRHPTFLTTLMTIFGIVVIGLAIHFAG